MDRPFRVENKLGADGAIAADEALDQAAVPDGYTALPVATNTRIICSWPPP